MEDRFSANHPGTARAPVYDDERHPDDEAAAVAFNATLVPLKAEWDALKNKLAAIVAKAERTPRHGWMLACLEDADNSVLMLLDDARE